jgi:iron complex outermembrane receptor protein
VGLFVASAVLLVPPRVLAQAPPAPEPGEKVSGKELVEMGFFQDFAELSLEDLLKGEEVEAAIASLHPEPLGRAPGIVSVFRGEDIRALGAHTLLDVLRLVPGLDVTVDAIGRTRISLRGVPSGLAGVAGGASENVLVLVDGQRLNEEVGGGAGTLNFDLPAEHIRQVEVLSGPGAALYGDAAVAGVVNVLTLTNEDFVGTEVSAGFGSFGTQQYVLRSGGAIKELQISGFIRFMDTSGSGRMIAADAQTLADEDRVAAGLPPISLAPGPVAEGRHTLDTNYRFSFREFTLLVRSRQEESDGYVGYANTLGRQSQLDNRQLLMELGWDQLFPRLGALRVRASFGQNDVRQLLEIYPSGFVLPTEDGGFVLYGEPGGNGGVFVQDALNSRRWGADARLDREVGSDHRLTAGAAISYDSTFDLKANANMDLRAGVPITGPSGLGPLPGAVRDAHRTVLSVHVQDAWTASSRLTLTGGFRLDHGSDFGATFNPRLALVGSLPGWLEKRLPSAVGRGLGFKLLYGRAYRAPTFRELYFELPGFIGNPDLEPAVSDTFEGALVYRRGRVKASVNSFLGLVGDAIVPAGPFSPTGSVPIVNARGYKVWGIQAEASGGFGRDEAFFANYTFQRSTDRATSERVAEIPSHLANLGATVNFGERYSLSPTLVVRGSRPRAPGDARPPVGGYALLDLAARGRRFWRTVEVVLVVQNVFNTYYVDPSPLEGLAVDYPRPGRSVRLHASFRF